MRDCVIYTPYIIRTAPTINSTDNLSPNMINGNNILNKVSRYDKPPLEAAPIRSYAAIHSDRAANVTTMPEYITASQPANDKL